MARSSDNFVIILPDSSAVGRKNAKNGVGVLKLGKAAPLFGGLIRLLGIEMASRRSSARILTSWPPSWDDTIIRGTFGGPIGVCMPERADPFFFAARRVMDRRPRKTSNEEKQRRGRI